MHEQAWRSFSHALDSKAPGLGTPRSLLLQPRPAGAWVQHSR